MEAMRKVDVLRAACCVSGVDGNAHAVERRILEMLAKEVGVGSASLDAMIHRAETEEDYYESQFRVLKSDPSETMKLLFSVALVDRELSTSELDVLSRLAQRLKLTQEEFNRMRAQAESYLKRQNVS